MAILSIPAADSETRRIAWTMVALATLGTMCGAISVLLINTGILMRPLTESFGWARGEITLSLSIGAIAMALANPLCGRLIDRHGVRRVLASAQFLYGISVALTPLFISKAGINGLYLGFALASGFGAGASAVPFMRLLSGWFAGPMLGSRGFAMGCAAAGVPLGAAISGPLAIALLSRFGWAGCLYGLSALPLLVGLPSTLLFLREPPTYAPTGGQSVKAEGMTFQAALRTKVFWMLVAMVLLIASCTQGLSIHIAPFLSDTGLSARGLASVTALSGMLAIIARLAAGWMFDRFFAPYVALANFALPLTAAVIMAAWPILPVALVGSVLLALGQGAESDFIGYLISRYFGLRHSGRIFGTVYGLFMVGIAIGPFLFGMAFDLLGDYRVPFTIAGVGLALLCVLLLNLPRYRDEVSD